MSIFSGLLKYTSWGLKLKSVIWHCFLLVKTQAMKNFNTTTAQNPTSFNQKPPYGLKVYSLYYSQISGCLFMIRECWVLQFICPERVPHIKILGHFIKSPIFSKRNKNQFYYWTQKAKHHMFDLLPIVKNGNNHRNNPTLLN